MNADQQFWQARYHQQVGWTKPVRRYLLKHTCLKHNARILEVGCGCGALLAALRADGYSHLYGLDIDRQALEFIPNDIHAIRADGLSLPFQSHSFHACLCHFYLLWAKDPLSALLEMKRVVRSGGWLLALAEPDYAARVDKPAELESSGKLQTQALINQGANPFIGGRLGELFLQVGLVNMRCGVIETQKSSGRSSTDGDMEWEVLASDLEGLLSADELERLHTIDCLARVEGTRVLYVPVHYACGRVA